MVALVPIQLNNNTHTKYLKISQLDDVALRFEHLFALNLLVCVMG